MAAGRGERMGAERPKCFLPLAGRPLFAHALATFAGLEPTPAVALVVPAGWEQEAERLCRGLRLPHPVLVVPGGDSRAESVRAGLEALAADPPHVVAIHDAARPLVSLGLIVETLRVAAEHGAALAATPVTDTLKRAGGDRLVEGTTPRAGLWRAQTPQSFRFELIREAHRLAREGGGAATDDAMLVEALGRPVRICPASAYNIKVTTPEDLAVAERLLEGGGETRIGHGYDLHRLVVGRPLILGGVQVPYERGLLGHSDGDAACHALADALLGAAALGDIGAHFPDTDPQYAGADSTVLLAGVGNILAGAGFSVVNCDVTVQAQAPRLRPYVEAMRARLAEALGVEVSRVSVKATTMEGLGPIGEGAAIAAHAVALVRGRRETRDAGRE
jgi:2-C-methyl-D-erythritol 4-phosphate cytidylyltransferase/2-C-methyl-D-erythritol 2,4-cyclodiphosphate synthase